MIVFVVIYQFMPYVAGTYALCASVAGYPSTNRRVWLVGLALAMLLAAVATGVMRHSLPPSLVPTRDLIAAYLSLYALPMISALAVTTGVQRSKAPGWAKLVVLLLASAGSILAGQHIAAAFFDMVNASG